MSTSESADSAQVAAVIRETLKGPVLDSLRGMVPTLDAQPRAAAYDHAIENLDLLEECFKTFRQQRSRFRHVLRDGGGRTVADDTTPLACGRSLAEVVAMIVRTAARRHFRSHFGKGKTVPAGTRPIRNEGDELYDALRHHLQHEWQVPLVPDYCRIKVAEARALGAKILDLKDRALLSSALSSLRGGRGGEGQAANRPVAALSGGGREDRMVAVQADCGPRPHQQRINLIGNYLTLDGKRLRGASFIEALALPEVRSLLPSHNAVTQFVPVLDRVGATAAAMLVEDLDMRADQMVVLLVKTQDIIGEDSFARLFGPGADARLTSRLIAHAKQAGFGTETPVADIARFVTIAFARMAAPGQRSAAS